MQPQPAPRPPDARRHTRAALLGLLLMALVTACGSPATGSGGGPAATATPTVAPVGTTTPPGAPSAVSPTATARAAASQLPATVKDKDGKEVTVTDTSRIVPLNGDIAEIVWALGLGGNVVATDTSATFPPEARALAKIGYQRQLAAEGILALNPTVVIGDEAAGPPATLEQLRGAGVPVVIVPDPPTLDTPAMKIRAVGAALGVPDRAEELAVRTQRGIDDARALAARATGKPKVMFLYVRGAGTQNIGGKGTSADVLIGAAGGADAGADAGISGYKPLTAEALAAAQPDVILLLSAVLDSIGGVEGLLAIPGVAQTPAGQQRRVLAYDDLFLLGMGPRTGQALRELTLGLHPELR